MDLADLAKSSTGTSRLRNPLFEPLEQRQVLTAGLSFDSTPFSIDPTTQNITVHYELSTAASAAFDIALFADYGMSPTLLVSESVSNPSLWTVGSHSFRMSAPFTTEPQEDYRLNVVLDPGDADVTAEFTGVFLEDSGIVQVFGTSGADAIEIGPETGSQIRVTLNAVDYFFDEADVTDIHVRAGAGDDYVEVLDDVDVPYWGFGGDGDDMMKGSAGPSYLSGGAGDDQLANGTGPLEVDGGTGTDTLIVLGTEDADEFFAWEGVMTMNGTTIESTNMHGLAVGLFGGDDLALIIESDLVALGMTSLLVLGMDGNNTIAVGGPFTGPAQAGLSSIYIAGGNGDDQIVFAPQNLTRGAGASLQIHGGNGDDTITIGQYSTDALPSSMDITISGGAGNDTLEINNLVSGLVLHDESAVKLSYGADVQYDDIENLTIDMTNSAETFFVSTLSGPMPNLYVAGDEEDTLGLGYLEGGAITSQYSGDNVFTGDGSSATVTSSRIANFYIQAQTVTIDGIALNQHYNISTDFHDEIAMENNYDGHIYLTGAVSVPFGFTTDEHRVLVTNISAATLHGGFSNNHVTVSSVEYLVEYENDVTLVTNESAAGLIVTPSQIILHQHSWTGSAYVMGHEYVPRFVTTPDVKSIASGDWSDPAIWSTGVVPTTGDFVRIAAYTTVTYDLDSSAVIEAIEVVGTLSYATDIDTKLVVGTLQVLPSGVFEIGTATNPVEAGVEAILEFADVDLNLSIDPAQHGRGLLGFGTVTIHGSSVVNTWLRLDEHAIDDDVRSGHTTLTFPGDADLTGWDVGELVVIPDTRQTWYEQFGFNHSTYETQTEVREIASIATVGGKKIVTLTAALSYDHLGAFETTLGATGLSPDPHGLTQRSVRGDRAMAGDIELRPHVGLLTRNVIVRSANASDSYASDDEEAALAAQRRGHILFSGRADVDIRYAMLKDLGRTAAVRETSSTDDTLVKMVLDSDTNHIGRYSIHFHHLTGPAEVGEGDPQYTFKGNTVQGSLKWAVVVHHTHYGLIEDNVVFDTHGSAFTTEDGSEIGNKFNRNFAVQVHGTHEGDGQTATVNGDFGIGGYGFWLRRAGNDFTNNAVADTTQNHLAITSYYHTRPMMLPDYPGAAGDNFSQVYLVPTGTMDNNDLYGPTRTGIWLAYTTGNNLLAGEHPETKFTNLRIWNTQNGVRGYHTTDVTFEDTWIYGDPERMFRDDASNIGMRFAAVYESRRLTIRDSHIEGMRIGITTPPHGVALVHETPDPTIIENTYLENVLNIHVTPAGDHINWAGHVIEIRDVDFEYMEYGKFAKKPTLNSTPRVNIQMRASSDQPNFTKPSVVRVINYDLTSEDFQVYYLEQAHDYEWTTANLTATNWSTHHTTIGLPVSGITNEDAWETYGIAMFGAIAPSTANSTSRPEIIGLTGPFTDYTIVPAGTVAGITVPSGTEAMAVFVTPWDNAEFAFLSAPKIRYNLIGQLPAGAQVWMERDGDSGTRISTLPTFPSNWLLPGERTLRIWIGDENGDDVANTIGYADAQQITVHVLPQITVQNNPSITEGDSGTKDLVFTIKLVRASNETVTVEFNTADVTATAGSDYIATSGTLTFAPGVTTQLVTVQILGDTDFEPDETFRLELFNPTDGLLTDLPFGTGTIINDD